MPKIEHDTFGSCDLPEMLQGEVEDFYRTLREVKAGMSGVDDAMAGDLLSDFVVGLSKSGAKLTPEQWQTTVSEYMVNLRIVAERRGQMTSAEYVGAAVRCAARLGWIDGDDDDVKRMSPAKVKWLSDEIQRLLGEAYTVDPS